MVPPLAFDALAAAREKSMRTACLAIAACLLGAAVAHAQSAPPSGKTLAATMNVYVFPTTGQDADKQSKEEAECYNWAASNTGSDPFSLSKQQAAQQQQTQQQVQQAQAASQGAGAKGALGGAAAGALIGEVANGNASQGAAWGAALGAVSSRRRAKERSQEAAASAQQSGAAKQQATAEQIENFKKAFSVCLEAKHYMVKY
jgi:hypothetical protein